MFGIIKDGTYRTESIGYSEPELTTGFVVAIEPVYHERDLPKRGTLFGRWTSPETGRVYWDKVEVIPELDEALRLAEARGELAIWDVQNAAEIQVGCVI